MLQSLQMSKLIPWVFFIALFLIFLLPPTDPDLGWQLRCGELFWQEHSFCENNQFSVLLENYSWPNHAWGYQAAIYPIFKFAGFNGLTIFNALLVTAAFGFLYSAIKNFRFEKMLGILATIYFGWGVFSFGIRSQLIGFFFFNLTLYLLTKMKERPKLAFLLPLVMLVWANTHGSVILGLVLISLSIGTTAVGSIRNLWPLKTLMLTFLMSVLATLINPFGFRIYEEMWRHFSGPIDLSKSIAEWVPPHPQIQQIIIVTGVAVLVYLLYRAFVAAGPWPALNYSLFLIPIFAFWALKARRNVPFHFVIISYSLLNALKAKVSPLRNQLAGLLSVGVLLYGLIIQLPKAFDYDPCQRDVPCQAVEFLKKQEPGPIFNRYEWGGFLIGHLPEYKIFVDGRMPAWPASARPSRDGPTTTVSPYTTYLHTLQTRPGWEETLEQHNIDWILISPNTFMDLKLREDPSEFGWQEVFRNKNSVVYSRQSPTPPTP